jgi:beta-lactamase superfamily II metal-dependent hydrolase
LPRLQNLQIDVVYASLQDRDWIAKNCDHNELAAFDKFTEALKKANLTVIDEQPGQTLDVDNVHFQVLGIRNPEFTGNPLNNSSVVLKVWDAKKSVLFLGDLGVEAGDKLLQGPFGDQLHADYVQMAHHGQKGVRENVYQAIRPSYCLWPTPLWLWDNDAGGGKGSGPFKTLETRAWMEKLPIQRHFVSAEGLFRID